MLDYLQNCKVDAGEWIGRSMISVSFELPKRESWYEIVRWEGHCPPKFATGGVLRILLQQVALFDLDIF